MTDHGWERWTEQVDWTDWRSWLRKVASTDWASAPWPSAPWEQAAASGGISLTLRAVEDDELDRDLAGVPAVVAGRPGHPAHRRAGRGAARRAHARTRPGLAAAGGPTGRGPRGGRHARIVEPAALPDRLFAGGGPAGRPGVDPQLRLGSPAVRRGGGQD